MHGLLRGTPDNMPLRKLLLYIYLRPLLLKTILTILITRLPQTAAEIFSKEDTKIKVNFKEELHKKKRS